MREKIWAFAYVVVAAVDAARIAAAVVAAAQVAAAAASGLTEFAKLNYEMAG
jgi:hypothetical protein